MELDTSDLREVSACAAAPAHEAGVVAAPSQRAAPIDDLDAQLMILMRDGDRDAGNQLVRRNVERVARFVGRVVRDSRVIEDLTQDVFKNMVRFASRYEPSSRFSTWLYRIATNVALDYLDRISVRRRENGTVSDDEAVADKKAQRPDRQLSLDELRAAVAAAVDSLPPNQRVAITLHQYEGLSYEQISGVMDASVESVRSLLARARATLREKLRGLA